jgi:DNA (cytosine-5)-methyltransferase 1
LNLSLPDQMDTTSLRSINLLSFFTGAGFLDIGFLQAGFNIVWHNEFCIPFVKGFEYGMEKIYGSGYSSKIQNTSSIINITPNQIVSEAFSNKIIPDVFGIIGGPPCPDFSVAGKQMGRDGIHGQLSQIYVDRILELKPTFFLFENVPGLIRTKPHRIFLSELLYSLSKHFELDIETLNSLDYGVPQDRERVFIIGIKRDWLQDYHFPIVGYKNINWLKLLEIRGKNPFASLYLNHPLLGSIENPFKSWFPWPMNPTMQNAKVRYSWPNTASLAQEVIKPQDIPEELMVFNYVCDEDELPSLPNSKDQFKPYSTKFSWILEGDVHRKSFKRLHRYRYSPSVAYGNNEVHLHPTENRRLSVRESMRLQTVPDRYSLPENMTLSDKFKTISNGVPVKLAYEVAIAFKSFLTKVINKDF